VNPFRTVGGRLALALLFVVGGALGIVYLIVVPSYRHSLLAGQLKDIRGTLVRVAAEPRPAPLFPSDAWIEDEAEKVTGPAVRVVVFNAPPLLEPVADSNGGTSLDVENDPVVAEAATSVGIVSGEVSRQGTPYAEAAESLGPGQSIVMVSTSIRTDLEAVAVVRRRVIVAGSLATVFAIVLGYGLATFFARRIRRLEAAAKRIADGRFDEIVVDLAPDELGQLARAFEQMRQRLASLERARNEFIANASHELRTPLFALAGFLELLNGEDELDSPTREDFLEVMREQVSRLTRLATVLLDLSRMDAGQLSMSSESVELGAVAETLASDFGPRAAAAGHPLHVALSGPVNARGDAARVLQIGRILVENAIVHTPPGSTVEIAVAGARHRATLSVTDDGPGIPEEAQTSVFERFYRLSGPVASGSGLGLAIARELAELMAGRVELESVPGRTRFTLVLPVDAEDRARMLEAAREG
jgi:signal transduction histidine kinase